MKGDVTFEACRVERLIAAGLAAQPALQAPDSLQAGVWEQLRRRAALPWWQRPFARWPRALRGGYLLLAFGIVLWGLRPQVWARLQSVTERWVARAGEPLSAWHRWSAAGAELLSLLHQSGRIVGQLAPAWWLYAVAASVFTAYLLLMGLGVAAWRVLYLPVNPTKHPMGSA